MGTGLYDTVRTGWLACYGPICWPIIAFLLPEYRNSSKPWLKISFSHALYPIVAYPVLLFTQLRAASGVTLKHWADLVGL